MADKNITVEIVTPEREVFSEPADFVVVPGVEGYLGILPNHAPIVAGVDIGIIKVVAGNNEIKFAVSGGFMEVNQNKVVLLADSAERGNEIDIDRARAAQERAQQRLANRSADVDVARAEYALRRAITRIKASGH
ncbi:MAG: F0F1 ATP synthase subunit epsilon [Thermincola sp.]|jgi:F-type H+-transporting ATPase subunit epsilon|nr:F0F1 ATP synthase subunit epsilon [Thermincola sp.]MDT3703493.1 F0F1 ATP synthase subunit epsilon [Thermincola sp.]